MLDVTKAERDSWKSQVQKVTALMENQSAKKVFRRGLQEINGGERTFAELCSMVRTSTKSKVFCI
jgi:hypothetical protein